MNYNPGCDGWVGTPADPNKYGILISGEQDGRFGDGFESTEEEQRALSELADRVAGPASEQASGTLTEMLEVN
jgi:hypothetical protein